MPALAQLATMVIDCADPGPLAEFYRVVTGWEVTYRDGDCVPLDTGTPLGSVSSASRATGRRSGRAR
jgi:Glyoxalase-like domain